jgi:outer membrane biosynthesis protein TonB
MRRSQRSRRERRAIAGYYLSVRLAGTAIICIVAAFGAAFLVARAVNRETPAGAATPPAQATRVADTTKPAAPKVNAELRSQFSPIKGSKLKPKPKPKPKHKKAKPRSPVTVTPSPSTTQTTPTYTTPSPTYTPTYNPPSAPTHSAPTHHKKSGGSSGGSGTTTIGG